MIHNLREVGDTSHDWMADVAFVKIAPQGERYMIDRRSRSALHLALIHPQPCKIYFLLPGWEAEIHYRHLSTGSLQVHRIHPHL